MIEKVMFIRMYILLQVFTLLDLYLHLVRMNRLSAACDDKAHGGPPRSGQSGVWYFFIFISTITGFLTHYYYIIFAFFISAFYCLWNLKEKRFREGVRYGGVRILALISSYLLFRSMKTHIIYGYRGKEAFENLFSSDLLWKNLRGLLNGISDSFYAGLLLVAMILSVFYLVLFYCGRLKKMKRLRKCFQTAETGGISRGVLCMMTAAAGYILVLCRISPMQMDYYYIPVFSIFIALSVYFLAQLIQMITGTKAAAVIFLSLWFGYTACVTLHTGAMNNDYLKNHQIASEYYAKDCMYVSSGETNINAGAVIYSFDELRYFDRVYYATLTGLEKLTDERIRNARELLVYIDSNTETEQALRLIGEQTGMTQWEYKYSDYVADVYLLR